MEQQVVIDRMPKRPQPLLTKRTLLISPLVTIKHDMISRSKYIPWIPIRISHVWLISHVVINIINPSYSDRPSQLLPGFCWARQANSSTNISGWCWGSVPWHQPLQVRWSQTSQAAGHPVLCGACVPDAGGWRMSKHEKNIWIVHMYLDINQLKNIYLCVCI